MIVRLVSGIGSAATAFIAVGGPYFIAQLIMTMPSVTTRHASAIALVCLWALFEGSLLRSESLLLNDNARQGLPIVTIALIALLLPFALIESRMYTMGHIFTGVTLGLMLFGIILRCLAISKLGQWFYDGVIVTAQQELVTTGIYSIFRHPSEIGLCSFLLGYTLFLTAWISVLITVLVLFPLSIYRCKREDLLLQQRFQSEFLTYRRRTMF